MLVVLRLTLLRRNARDRLQKLLALETMLPSNEIGNPNRGSLRKEIPITKAVVGVQSICRRQFSNLQWSRPRILES